MERCYDGAEFLVVVRDHLLVLQKGKKHMTFGLYLVAIIHSLHSYQRAYADVRLLVRGLVLHLAGVTPLRLVGERFFLGAVRLVRQRIARVLLLGVGTGA